MVLPVLWVLLAALALALSWATRCTAFAWVGYLMLAIWLIGFAIARLSERGVHVIRQLSADRVPFGGGVAVEVQVANRGRLPLLWLAASEVLPPGLPMTGIRGRVGSLGAGRSFAFQYTLHGARRGYYELGPTLVRTGDLFGLTQRGRTEGGVARLTVFPRVLAIQHSRLPSRRPASDVRARQRVLEDPTQVVGIRPYQHGDELRRVHWRATAHTGRLQSKLFQVTAQVEAALVLNLRRQDYPGSATEAEELSELAIAAVASIAQHLLDRGQRVRLSALGRDPARAEPEGVIRVRGGRGRFQLAAVLSALGRIERGASGALAELLSDEKESLPWGALVVLVTPGLPEGALSAVLGLRQAGFEVNVILVGREARPSLRGGLAVLGVPSTRLTSEAGIRGLGL